jgi:hypothetical protein
MSILTSADCYYKQFYSMENARLVSKEPKIITLTPILVMADEGSFETTKQQPANYSGPDNTI